MDGGEHNELERVVIEAVEELEAHLDRSGRAGVPDQRGGRVEPFQNLEPLPGAVGAGQGGGKVLLQRQEVDAVGPDVGVEERARVVVVYSSTRQVSSSGAGR